MGKRVVFSLLISVLSGMVCVGVLLADDNASNKDQAVKRMGVSWNIAEDRRMATYGGVYQPEGLDIYMKRYFDQFSARIDQLSSKIDQLKEQDSRLEKKIDDLLSRSPGSASSRKAY